MFQAELCEDGVAGPPRSPGSSLTLQPADEPGRGRHRSRGLGLRHLQAAGSRESVQAHWADLNSQGNKKKIWIIRHTKFGVKGAGKCQKTVRPEAAYREAHAFGESV